MDTKKHVPLWGKALVGMAVALAVIFSILMPNLRDTQMPQFDIIQFGGHDWLVLDVQGDYALIITENIISHRMYHHTFEAVTWETSEIREYLNSTFFYTFSESDRIRIRETTIINNDNPWDFSDAGRYAATPGGNNTIDRIFLLSIEEVVQYFGDSGMLAIGATMNANDRHNDAIQGLGAWRIFDQYSNTRIARDTAGSASWWWLRSPGSSPRRAAYVFDSISIDGAMVFLDIGGGVRPALWLDMGS